MATRGRRRQLWRVTAPAERPDGVRIVLARMPRLLRDLLRDALERHSHVLVQDDYGDDAIGAIVARARPDGVILGALGEAGDPATTDEITQALFRSPRTRVLLVSGSGTSARLHELLPTCTRVDDVTPDGLGAAILARLAPPAARRRREG